MLKAAVARLLALDAVAWTKELVQNTVAHTVREVVAAAPGTEDAARQTVP